MLRSLEVQQMVECLHPEVVGSLHDVQMFESLSHQQMLKSL